MTKKIKYELFKGPIMATVKVLGMYQGLPTYGTRSFFMWICFGLPFIPIFKYSSNLENHVPPILLLIYFVLYAIQTFILGRFISKISRQWTLEEYEKLTPDKVTFPFIFALGIHSLFHFLLFSLINNLFDV